MKLRIACVQFNPLLGRVEANITKIHSLLTGLKKEIDLLVLPELSVSGYNFSSPHEIEPYLESSGTGPSFRLAEELSKKFKCTTIIGYPEKFQGITYNSALVVDELGLLVYNYRKTHLYETDEGWGCSENPDKTFLPLRLTLGKGGQKKTITSNIGICMDINPYQFTAPFNAFEFSLLCWENSSDLIIVPTAWLSSNSPSIQEDWPSDQKISEAHKWTEKFKNNLIDDSSKPSTLLINYWLLRFFPFLSSPHNQLPKLSKKTTLIVCNRVGVEGDVLYGGSSSVFQFDPSIPPSEAVDVTNPSVNVLCSAGWASEEIIYLEVEI